MEDKNAALVYGQLVLLGAIWGASFLFLRIAAPEFGPLALILIRTLVAALTLLPLILFSGEYKVVLKNWYMFVWLGASTVAIPFSLFAYVSLHITAGGTSLLNATTPMFSAVVSWLWLQDQLTLRAIAGLLFGFAGVFVLSLGNGGSLSFDLWPILAALLAASLYAYGSCFARKYLNDFKSSTIAAGCQFASALLLLPLGIYFWPSSTPSLSSWVSSILLGVFCTAIALILFFNLIKKVGVTRTVSVTYLIPVFGILFGALFLDEGITLSMLAGGFLVMFGVALTSRKKKKPAN